ncbi:MAG: glycogen debranching protein GlgX [Acetobacteraceae bacterium]|nr:glycogen debranching protein GlgX [Acetobacteraceae bacterium]
MTHRLLPGEPRPLGATLLPEGVNVAVFSAHATRIELCLFDPAGRREIARHDLPERTDEVFHGLLPAGAGGRAGLVYGLRAHGPWRPEEGHLFNPAKLLLDPYATLLRGGFAWNPALLCRAPGGGPDPRDSAPFLPKAVVAPPAPPRPEPWRPRVPWARSVIYEAHVKGFTRLHPGVPPALCGTLAALGEPAVIGHLRRIGVTTLELMPVNAFAPSRFQAERGLAQYWGYSPLALFAPHPPYLGPAGDAAEEAAAARARGAIRALQEAGIEVILDVVLNHSCEGDEEGIVVSWRGLDNASYYRRGADTTGCGNAFDFGHPRVVAMALDALRHWASAWGVDGFRLDLAATLGRGRSGAFEPEGPFLAALLQDPLLSRLKLIAEPWDAGPGGYRLGGFPPGIAEWNDRFRDTARRFWRGDPGQRGELAARLAGSADIFDHRGRRPHAGINFITAHDGFTLADLVSYARRHNEANGEGNRDGPAENVSANWGAEGPTQDPAIRRTRGRVARALLATLFAAQGTPMILGGDEMLRTQRGNTNAYCQDNEISWLDWSLAATPEGAEMLGFVRRLAAIRAAHPSLRHDAFLHGAAEPLPGIPDISWFGAEGEALSPEAWARPEERVLALRRLVREAGVVDATLVLVNAGPEAREIRLPAPPLPWRLLLCSAEPDAPEAEVGPTLPLPARALRILGAAVPAA